jgi:hypothetical protein
MYVVNVSKIVSSFFYGFAFTVSFFSIRFTLRQAYPFIIGQSQTLNLLITLLILKLLF